MQLNAFLPEPLPADPMPTFLEWFDDARTRGLQPNPDAMVLASVGEHERPSARVVLCKRVDRDGHIVFFTNYDSRKGQELINRPRAAAVLHWDALHRQVRVEGAIVRSPIVESDQYFASRALQSRIGAWASHQSRPLASRAALAAQVETAAASLGISETSVDAHVPRPPHWGGFRLWIDTLELWVEGPGRIHDRAMWTRTLRQRDEFSFEGAEWRGTRLNP